MVSRPGGERARRFRPGIGGFTDKADAVSPLLKIPSSAPAPAPKTIIFRRPKLTVMRLLLLLFTLSLSSFTFGQARFTVTLPKSMAEKPLDGRLLVLLSTNTDAEPRF